MPQGNKEIQNFAEELANVGLLDKINSEESKKRINQLTPEEQKSLAENTVILWLKKNLSIDTLLNIKQSNPYGEKNLTGFNLYLGRAVDIVSAFNLLNIVPAQALKELGAVKDTWNDMEGLKSHLIQHAILPNLDGVVSKLNDIKDRNLLAKYFQNEESIRQPLGEAILVKNLVESLKGDKPWEVFNSRDFNYDMFLSHATLVYQSISAEEAGKIGKKLGDAPTDCAGKISQGVHNLKEAFSGLNRQNNSESVFAIMSRSLFIDKKVDSVAKKSFFEQKPDDKDTTKFGVNFNL